MKPLVIYHANCADGFGAAFACWLKLGDEAEYLPMNYGNQSPDMLADLATGREVYIFDFSFPKLVMDHIFASAKRVVWLDHQRTAAQTYLELHPEMERGDGKTDDHYESYGHNKTIINQNKSGALLAWEYFHPDTEVPMLIKHIDDYNRWQFKLDGTKAFNKALWSYAPWSFEQWKQLLWLMNPAFSNHKGQYERVLTEGSAILRAHDQNVQSVVKGSARNITMQWEEQDYPIYVHGLSANCPPHLTSDVGHELANQSGTFGLCWTLSQKGLIANCSLRSNGNYDVSAIAKVFGGGGHKNAAGFEVDISTLLRWIK